MSSLTRTIQARPGYKGRGGQLGVTNREDPCRTGKKKAPKPFRSPKAIADGAAPRKAKHARYKSPGPTAAKLPRSVNAEAHIAEMIRRASARDSLYAAFSLPRRVTKLLGLAANLNRRTGKPHMHHRAKAAGR